MSLRDNLERVLNSLEHAAESVGRETREITLVAVTKGVKAERIKEAVALGLCDFGENRVQEAREKVGDLGAGVKWHLIGPLQTNKVSQAVRLFSLFHALDREVVAERLAEEAEKTGRSMPALVEVNVGGESTKAGIRPEDAERFLDAVSGLPGLSIRGLMTVPPRVQDPEAARPFFRELRRLRDRLESRGYRLPELSMGMSDDFTVAVQEGATYVRIGRALFGPRDEPEPGRD